MSYLSCFLILLLVCMTTACDRSADSASAQDKADITEDSFFDAEINDEIINADDTSDEACGSLKPLLNILPTKNTLQNLPETYRGCNNNSEQSVEVVYNNQGEEYSEYNFRILVVDGHSPYVKSWMEVDGATESQRNFLRKGLSVTGDMHKSVMTICQEYYKNPIIPDGRNPIVAQVRGINVCIMDNMDANKEVWQAFAFYKDLKLHLEFTGAKAGKILTTEEAKLHLLPLFELFQFSEERQADIAASD